MRELKLRGLVKRTLVIAPKGLVSQWVSEMRFHFGETFQLVLPEDIKTLNGSPRRRSGKTETRVITSRNALPANAWQMFSQVVVPMDSVKPLDKRRGWSAAQVDEYNRERFEDLISAGWDLVIVDEAHRLGAAPTKWPASSWARDCPRPPHISCCFRPLRIRARPMPFTGWCP